MSRLCGVFAFRVRVSKPRHALEALAYDAYIFFKHEDAGTGPKFAARFLELAGA
jgi:hypothetical protein